jgi:hypothetical protein
MFVDGRKLRELWKEKGKAKCLHHINEGFVKGDWGPNDFSIRNLAENLIGDGREFVNAIDSRRRGVMEDVTAVDTSTFSSINRQIIFSTINEAMQLDELIGDKLVTVMPSNLQERELIPGISAATDEFEAEVPEGKQYPSVGLSEEYVELPRAEKHGGIIGITREAIVADRTGVLIERARSIGSGLAIRREKSILDVFIGGVNPYVRKGIARNTYANIAGTSYFDNIITDALVNYTDVQAAANLFFQQRDPNTGEPLGHSPTTFVCCPDLMWTARPVFRDTSVRLGDITAAPGIQSIGNNRIPWDLELLTNEWLTMRLLHHNGNGGLTTTDRALSVAHWFIGRPRDAFVWKQIWPLDVEEAPANNEAMFNADVIARFKVSYKGVAGVREPRYMIRSDGTA